MTQICSVCGGTAFGYAPILPGKLVADWELSPEEAAYVNRQQGEHCTACYSNLRSIVLANALRAVWGTTKTLRDYCASAEAAGLSVLELNPAGTLHDYLVALPGHRLGAYPEIDMHALPFPDATFDTVVHSDTLEHVADPVGALVECLRVTRPGGAVCYTVPIVVGRLSRDRVGLPASHHGPPDETRDDYLVHTEFGADAWTHPMRAGAAEVRIFSVAHPAAHAIAAFRVPPSATRTEELAHVIDVMRRSTSWRITAPLRALGRLLK